MSLFNDVLSGVTGSISSLADIYVKVNQSQIDAGLSANTRTIDELKNSISLMQQQAQLQAQYAQQSAAQSGLVDSPMLKWALVAGGLFLAYKLIK